MSWIAPIVLFLEILLLLYVATMDIATRSIRNEICLALALLGIAGQLASPLQIAESLIAATILLLLLLVIYQRRLIGGGDVKLLASTVLLVGYHATFLFLAVMSICGGLLAVAIFLWLLAAKTKKQPSVPYGVAIAAGAIITLSLNPMIG